ncbi:MAG TPA: DUF2911 domain-containing protein [Ignavibacteriaceae bacterium]|nr:DUF2911 domain-containing protein [Ignavibacteriaceae bacterium]
MNSGKRKSLLFFGTAFLFLMISGSSSGQFRTPRPSPNASVNQLVGVTDITIHYSRPGVKNRVIWGELVPYNQVWRTGANEVTSITFTDPVTIFDENGTGTKLEAGTYGIHTIPAQNEWTIIFSKNTEAGASSDYIQENDALRINVKPAQSDFQERLIFTFSDLTDSSASVNLMWEKLKVSFKIEAATRDLIMAKAEQSIDWNTPMQAANYCLQNSTDLDKGMKWINISTMINENYWNTRLKARFLEKTGNKAEAITLMEKALEMGKKMEQKPFDYDQMEKLLAEWKG